MRNDFRKNLRIGFGLSLFLLLLSTIASFVSISNLINSANLVNHTNLILQESEAVISSMKDAETGQRGFLITKDYDFLQTYTGSYEKTMATLERLKNLTSDNPDQQKNCSTLSNLIIDRFNTLQRGIDEKKSDRAIDVFMLRKGKEIMDQARTVVKRMQEIEGDLLTSRTARMNRFANYTPILIVFAALLSFLITIYFYRRVMTDFKERTALADSLNKKDIEINNRLSIIQKIAWNISNGDYKIRVNEVENDILGGLSESLNRMAVSLENSFNEIKDQEWLQKGTAQLSERMMGEKDITQLSNDIISFICSYVNSHAGVLYLKEDNQSLHLKSSYAYTAYNGKNVIKIGEGIIGQCVLTKKAITINEITDETFYISTGAGNIKPKSIIAFPLFFERQAVGAIELATIQPLRDVDIEFLQSIAETIGVALNTAGNRIKVKELLEETQAQAEELQLQHSELENLNTELETQSEKLQTSEEELKVQQEELLETNQELEERSRLLEEKNHLIVERNLEIQKKAEELELNAKYKSEFLANMSHELRTPLNSILLLSRLLSENTDKTLNTEQVEYARVIQSSGNGLLQLIDEILDLSKIESGKMQLDYETISLEEISNDLKMLFEPLAKEKNVSFNIHIDGGLPKQIETDKLRLEQIIKNLISNALKFTHKGYIHLSISPVIDRPGFINFSVKDTGIGISKEKQELVFEAFQQADGSTKRKYGGTGLGLSISKQLAALLSGDIFLNSEPGIGSEFILQIPIDKHTAMAQPASQESKETDDITGDESFIEKDNKKLYQHFVLSETPEDIPDDRADIAPGNKSILIVEDDTVFAKALLDFTRKKGYKGIVTVRGDYAIELAKAYRPSGILLDVQLPLKDGLQVMDELKKEPSTRHIPVHMLSSFEVKKESISRGAVDFINKPVAPEQMNAIFAKIEQALNRDSQKVLIVEENAKHALALAHFLSTHEVNSEISGNVGDSIQALMKKEVNCVILDMGIPDIKAYETLEAVKKSKELENVPIIIFTGKSLSRNEEHRIRQYADSIVVKTAHSYQRILDEISLFLHLVEENGNVKKPGFYSKKLGSLDEVLQNKKVLIADDDVRNIFSLTKSLEKHKMQIISAMDGKEALQALNDNPDIQIVLMDMMMPEMDGYESIKQIRKNPKWKNLPVIAVTAKAMTGDREKCIEIGASDYISKPVDTDQLISLLRIWLYENYR